jgi:hypothetical protein
MIPGQMPRRTPPGRFRERLLSGAVVAAIGAGMVFNLLSDCGVIGRTDPGGDRLALAMILEASFLTAGRTYNPPYVVTQAEFQEVNGDLWWVLQLDDPTLPLLEAPFTSAAQAGADLERRMFVHPLELYRDVVSQRFAEMGDVTGFILSFRDRLQTAVEIPRAVMASFIEGRITTKDVLDAARISSLNI